MTPIPHSGPRIAPAADAELWTVTQDTVAGLAQTSGWSDAEHTTVIAALQWRHDRMLQERQAIMRGAVSAEAGRASLLAAVEQTRQTVVQALGTERADALSVALAQTRLGAGL